MAGGPGERQRAESALAEQLALGESQTLILK